VSYSGWKWSRETEHEGGVVVCGDCFNPLYDPGYHAWGKRGADGKREKACIDEPVGAFLFPAQRALLAALVLFAAVTLSAQTIIRCGATSERLCKLTQPATYQDKKAQPPFNAPVMSGGRVTVSGMPYWLWLKAGEPPTPCTAKTHAVSPGGVEPRCSAKIGDPFYITQQFTVTAARAATLSAAAIGPRVQLSIAPSCRSLTEDFTVPRYACLRISESAGVVKFEVAHFPAYRGRFEWKSWYPVATDGSITIPYHVDGGTLGARRVAIYAVDSEGTYTQVLPETRLLDLPIWTGAQ